MLILDLLQDTTFWYALIAGLGLAILAAPFGCFIVWKRMSYFGDGLAHSALLGAAIAGFWGISPFIGVLVLGGIISLLLAQLKSRIWLGHDTLWGILSYGSLAAGLALSSWLPGGNATLMAWLLGDILAISLSDLIILWVGIIIAFIGLALIWKSLLFITVDEDMASAEGHPAARIRSIQMLLMALAVAMMIKIVGVLLVTALLITPAATARRFSRTPEQMVLFAAIIGQVAVVMGLIASWSYDISTGPAIVLSATAVFICSLLLPRKS